MRNELDLLEQVDRYLDGVMDTTEHAAFTQRLVADPELNTAVEQQRHLREGLERLALRPAVAWAYRAHRFGKWKPWLGGAAVVLVAVVGWNIWTQLPREEPEMIPEVPAQDTLIVPSETSTRKVERTIRYTTDTIRDTVYRVLQNGRWKTVKARPEGAQTLEADPASQSSRNEAVGEDASILSGDLVDERPDFPGGMDAFYRYLKANIRHPDLKTPLEGTVEVSFVINEQGAPENVRIVKGLGGAYDAEALRVISDMPKWIPAKQRGKPVKCRLQMPMQFRNPGVESAPMLK